MSEHNNALLDEVQKLRERVAFLEGRRRGSFRTLEVVVPVVLAILALLGYSALSTRISYVIDQRVEAMVMEELGRRLEAGAIEDLLEAAVREAVADSATQMQQAVQEAQNAAIEAELAANEAEDAAGDAANAADSAEEAADSAEEAADTIEAVATETASETR